VVAQLRLAAIMNSAAGIPLPETSATMKPILVVPSISKKS